MDRLQKKCLLSSAGMHGFLMLLLAFGSAFFVSKKKDTPEPKLQFVPSKFIENALAGGGGNPNIARTDDVQKGSPDAPKQVVNPAPQPAKPLPATPLPEPPAPEPEPASKRAEKKVEKPEPAKPEPKISTKKPTPKPTEVTKPTDKPVPVKPRIDLSELKPVTRTTDDKRKAEAEEEAREQARQRTAAIAAANAARKRLASQFGKAASEMQRGFEDGTKVEVGGPGGEAYASYSAFVQAAYQSAWKTQTKLFQELNDEDFAGEVRVVIAKDGRVVEARITRRSPSAVMNRCMQRTLDSVRRISEPFPAYITESERAFTIEFNLKTNRTSG